MPPLIRSSTLSTSLCARLSVRHARQLRHTAIYLPCRALSSSRKQYSADELADHSWRQTNHLWKEQEIEERIATANVKHVPQSVSDRAVQMAVRGMYHGFNFATGYNAVNPPVASIEWRLILLEAFAGVPGFIGAGFRHFRSLRTLKRDHGFIFSLLEEAENERMHLLVCMKMFEAGYLTRFLVMAMQAVATPVLMGVYIVRPQALHRFVGYLEETAVHTYTNIVEKAETPGTHVHEAWAQLPAPKIAINYWKMKPDATWVDTLKRMLADESHHRDVNHTFASMPSQQLFEQDNPFIHEHVSDYEDHAREHAEKALKKALHDVSIRSQDVLASSK